MSRRAGSELFTRGANYILKETKASGSAAKIRTAALPTGTGFVARVAAHVRAQHTAAAKFDSAWQVSRAHTQKTSAAWPSAEAVWSRPAACVLSAAVKAWLPRRPLLSLLSSTAASDRTPSVAAAGSSTAVTVAQRSDGRARAASCGGGPPSSPRMCCTASR